VEQATTVPPLFYRLHAHQVLEKALKQGTPNMQDEGKDFFSDETITTPEDVPMTDDEALLSKSLLRIDESAILLDVTPRTVNRYMELGRIDFKLTPSGRRRILTETVKRYL
jgi:hypothetical protein